MKWSLFFCLLLASTALARPRTKRSIGHLKSFVNKLFGIGGKTVIVARPILSNNETSQLFRIPGIDDFLVKVNKNDKNLETDKPTLEIKDPVIVKPEVAIIGSYLGTKTQKETLLAMEMVKNLVMTGILTGRLDSSMQKLSIPQGLGGYIEEGVLTLPLQVTEEEGHIFVPESPEFFVPPELNVKNPDSKYYYKEEGNMTYESHGNQDVLVTRTEKQNLQVSDAATNENVCNSSSVPISQPLIISGPPATYYVNQGMIAGLIPLPTQNQIPLFNDNQGISGNMPEKGQNLLPAFYVNEGTKVPGNGQIPSSGYYVNQDIIFGQGKHPPTYYVNQGIASGGIYYANPGAVVGSPGQIPLYLAHGMGKPSINEIGPQFLGNDVNGGAVMPDRNRSLLMDAVVNPYYFGNNAQKVIICKKTKEKACPYHRFYNPDKTKKITLNPTQNINKQVVNLQSVANINNTFGNAYQQINSHSKTNYTQVKLSQPSVVETNQDLNKYFVYVPPMDPSIALSLKNEGQNGNDDAFTSIVNVRTNNEEIKRFMPSNRLQNNVINFKQNPIVVAEKRCNKTDKISSKPDDNSKGQIPGSTY